MPECLENPVMAMPGCFLGILGNPQPHDSTPSQVLPEKSQEKLQEYSGKCAGKQGKL